MLITVNIDKNPPIYINPVKIDFGLVLTFKYNPEIS